MKLAVLYTNVETLILGAISCKTPLAPWFVFQPKLQYFFLRIIPLSDADAPDGANNILHRLEHNRECLTQKSPRCLLLYVFALPKRRPASLVTKDGLSANLIMFKLKNN